MRSLRSYFDDLVELVRTRLDSDEEQRGGFISGHYDKADTPAEVKIGDIESTGDHKGEIYGGIWSEAYGGDDKPIWVSQLAPRLMDHFYAAAWAKERGGALPTREQGDYLTTLKGSGGAFTEIFNRGDSTPAGFVWLAEPNNDINTRYDAWCKRLSYGGQYFNVSRHYELSVLSVRR